MKRFIVLIDGYNLYHAIDDAKLPSLKWLDLIKLSRMCMRQEEYLETCIYFSAYATWKPQQYKRHRSYVEALKSVGVRVVLGHFKKKYKKCRHCSSAWTSYEEKESDVHIGITIVDLAHRKAYDRLMLISADTDMAPALRMAKAIYPQGLITIAPPPRDTLYVSDLLNASDHKQRISIEMIRQCRFDSKLERPDHTIIQIPDAYL